MGRVLVQPADQNQGLSLSLDLDFDIALILSVLLQDEKEIVAACAKYYLGKISAHK